MPTLELWLSCFTKPLSTMYLNVDKNGVTMCLPKGVRETAKPLYPRSLLTLCHRWWERLQQCLWPRHTFLFLEVVAEKSAVVDLRQEKTKKKRRWHHSDTTQKADTGSTSDTAAVCVYQSAWIHKGAKWEGHPLIGLLHHSDSLYTRLSQTACHRRVRSQTDLSSKKKKKRK